MSYPLPDHYSPGDNSKLYVERGGRIAKEAEQFAKINNIAPASKDSVKRALFIIDAQVCFCHPEGSLYVPGAIEDTKVLTEFIYRNLGNLTSLSFSLDTHRTFQIFHPAMWIDADGSHPDPFTVITYDDIKSGKWSSVHNPKECMEYCKRLENTGKYVLIIWPYHAMLGSAGHCLMPSLFEASMFHSIARKSQTEFETKGTHAMTENYSVLSPEVKELGGKPVGQFNTRFFEMLMKHDEVYIGGEAKSHCLKATMEDIQKEIEKRDPSLMSKIFILEDATSPVPATQDLNFPDIASRAFTDFGLAGMNIVKGANITF